MATNKAVAATATVASASTFADRANSAAGKAALASYLDMGNGALAMVQGLVGVFARDDAEDFLKLVNKLKADAASKRTNTIVVPEPVHPVRKAEVNGLLKAAHGWDCYGAFLNNMSGLSPSLDTIVRLTNWFRSKDLNVAKKDGTAPTLNDCIAHLSAKKKAKAATTSLQYATDKPATVVNSIIADLTDLITAEGKTKPGAFLATALKAMESYRPVAVEKEVLAGDRKSLDKKRAKLMAGKASK